MVLQQRSFWHQDWYMLMEQPVSCWKNSEDGNVLAWRQVEWQQSNELMPLKYLRHLNIYGLRSMSFKGQMPLLLPNKRHQSIDKSTKTQTKKTSLNINQSVKYINTNIKPISPIKKTETMTDLKLIGICLHEMFDNWRHKVDVSFLAHLTTDHQLVEREIGRYSIEMPETSTDTRRPC